MKPNIINIRKCLLCLLLSLTTLLFAACNGDGGDISSETSDNVAESAVSKEGFEWLEGLDDANGKYKDKTFNIISVSKSLFYDESDNPLARAVTNRNGLIQQYMDISISCTEKSADKITAELKQAIQNGTQYADLICAPQSVLSALAAEGLLENLYSLPYVDFNAGYIAKGSLSAQTAGNTMYMYSGELTQSIGASTAIYYNKALLSTAGGNPIDCVQNGSLTWDNLKAMAQLVADSGSNAIYSLLDDEELAAAIYGSSGKSLIKAGDGVSAESVYDTEAAQTTANIINALFKDSKLCANYDEKTAINAFKTGKLAFVVASLDSVSLFDGCESEWGLLPLPKHSSEQSGFCGFYGNNALAVAVPVGCADSAFSGFVLNALLAASANTIEPALKSTYIHYHFWSNDAAVVLNQIARTSSYDLGIVYSSEKAVADVGTALLVKENGGAVSDAALEAFGAFAAKMFY